nr:DNA-binding protein [uncultured Acetatifactor sp.]
MLDYISVKEAAQKWGISERRVQKLCEGSRIDGIVRFGHAWMIPRDAGKPADQRRKEKREEMLRV